MHISVLLQRRLCAYPAMELYSDSSGVRLFARRTFTTPKIRTFTTPKFRHFPPPKKNICQEDNCHPQFFSSFFGALFLAFSTYSSWRTSRMGRRRCLMRWSWSTSSTHITENHLGLIALFFGRALQRTHIF